LSRCFGPEVAEDKPGDRPSPGLSHPPATTLSLEAPWRPRTAPSSTRSPTTCSLRRWSRRPWRWPSLRFAIAQRAIPDERRTLETELARVEAELDRLIGAIAAGGVLDAVRAREGRSRELSRRLAALEGREIRALAW